MSRALLDVNVLLALLDSDHVEHSTAWSWFDSDLDDGWTGPGCTGPGS